MEKPSDFGGLFSCRRIIITGANGAGKTRLAQGVAKACDLDVTHNDALVLRTGWARRSAAEVAQLRDQMAAQDAWVIEGGPSVLCQATVKARSDLVIWIDLPRWLRCWRIMRRAWQCAGTTRPELPDGNPEGWNRRHWQFVRKAWQRDAHVRAVIAQALVGFEGDVLHLTTRRAVDELMRACAKEPLDDNNSL